MEIVKILFFSFVLIFGLLLAGAQVPVNIGIKAGLNFASLRTPGNQNASNSGYVALASPDLAIHVNIQLFSHFSFQTQLEYSCQGGSKNTNQAFAVPDAMKQMFPSNAAPAHLYANYKSVSRLNYLIVPLLLRYHFGRGKHLRYYAAAGTFISFLASATKKTTGQAIIYLDQQHTQPLTPAVHPFDNTTNTRNDVNTFNKGITGFMGIGYKTGKSRFFAEGGGNYGFYNIQRLAINGDNHTRAITFNTGYELLFTGTNRRGRK